jgi:hypothetical protein
MEEEKPICAFCSDPIEVFAVEGPSGALICMHCLNSLLEVMTLEVVRQQAQHSTLN